MELTATRRVPLTVLTLTVAVVLAIVVVAQFVVLSNPRGDHVREGDTLTAEVAAVSSTDRSLCIVRDGSDDTCGFPIVLPDSEGQLVAGRTVTVTELWLTQDGRTTLAWLVR